MSRTVLIHLNVGLDPEDDRAVADIAASVMGALAVGLDPEQTNLDASQFFVALAEEV